jgi:hypothetical protein
MEQKTKINAEDGKQDLVITREFDLPLELLFEAYVEPDIVEQWMGTKVLKLESKKHGCYQFETSDAKGNLAFRANGVIMNLTLTIKLHEHLKWRICLMACNLSYTSLNN